MKKTVILFFLILSCPILQAQDESTFCQCETILDYRFEDYIDVFNSDDSSFPIARVRNNPQEDEFLVVEIIGRSDSLFRVNIRMAISNNPFQMNNVFVRKEHLIILSRLLNHPMPLYSQPSKSSTIVKSIEDSYGHIYEVIDSSVDWLRVVYTDGNNNRYEGWMAKEYQCSNIYSSCMGQ